MAPTETCDSCCNQLIVNISNFDKFTSDELNSNASLQHRMSDVTHRAIVGTTTNLKHDAYYVTFDNASTSGSLYITFSLCIKEHDEKQLQNELELLDVVINEYAENISFAIKSGLIGRFGVDSDTLTVNVYLTEFSCYFVFIVLAIFRELIQSRGYNVHVCPYFSTDNGSLQREGNDSAAFIIFILFFGVMVVICIVGCTMMYILFRRRRLRDGAKVLNEISSTPYYALSSGDDDRALDDRNGTKTDFKRNQSEDSIYDDVQSEGQIIPLPENTPTEEGAGSNTAIKETS